MFKNVSHEMKLLIPTFGILFILIGFGATIIWTNYTKMHILQNLYHKIVDANYISNLVHSLQKERGLSSGFVTQHDQIFKKELHQQRIQTDNMLLVLTSQLDKDAKKEILDNLRLLSQIRDCIDTQEMDSKGVMESYSTLTSFLLKKIAMLAKVSHLPDVTQNILAYSNLLYLKEHVGQQRALGVVILSMKNQKSFNDFMHFSNLIALEQQNDLMFHNYVTDAIDRRYDALLKTQVFQKIKKLEVSMLHIDPKQDLQITPQEWYQLMTKKLDMLDKVAKYIKENTTHKIDLALHDAKNIFVFASLLVFISLLFFVVLIKAFIKLALQERKLRIVMDKYIISSITDTKGRILDVSEAFCEIAGYTKRELIGKNHNIVRHPDTPKEVFRELWEKLKNGQSWSGKIKNRTKDGGYYWVYAHIEPLYNEKGEIDSYIAIRLDITENELLSQEIAKKEEQNKQQERMMQHQHRLAQMGEMMSMIAHQWRQPLSAITAASGSLALKAQLKKLDDAVVLDTANKIKEFSLHLSETIDDFRNFFKTNKTKTKTDFKKILDGVLKIIESSLEKNNIELTIDMQNLQEFESYENEMKQVLLNLIKNAEDILVEKKEQDRKISIFIDGLTLRVHDNAGGVPSDIIDKIFEPYFSTKLKKDGTGLGLYMSKTIVEEHCNGILKVENIDGGASFSIIIKGE